MSGNFFTKQEIEDFERVAFAGPEVIVMNPRDYAALKRFVACSEHIYGMECRLGRRLGRIERRWVEAKFYKRKCKPEFVDPIPFPKEEP